jgi:hypothetical protein
MSGPYWSFSVANQLENLSQMVGVGLDAPALFFLDGGPFLLEPGASRDVTVRRADLNASAGLRILLDSDLGAWQSVPVQAVAAFAPKGPEPESGQPSHDSPGLSPGWTVLSCALLALLGRRGYGRHGSPP